MQTHLHSGGVELVDHGPDTRDTARHRLEKVKLRSIVDADVCVCQVPWSSGRWGGR